MHTNMYTFDPTAKTLIGDSFKPEEGHFHKLKPLENGEDKGKILGEKEKCLLPEVTPTVRKMESEKLGYPPFSLENFS